MPSFFTTTLKVWKGLDVGVGDDGFPNAKTKYYRFSNSCREVWLSNIESNVPFSYRDENAVTLQLRLRLLAPELALSKVEKELNDVYTNSLLRFERRSIRIWNSNTGSSDGLTTVASVESSDVSGIAVAWWAILFNRIIHRTLPSTPLTCLELLELSNAYDDDVWATEEDKEEHIDLWKQIRNSDPCNIFGYSGLVSAFFNQRVDRSRLNPARIPSVVEYIAKQREEYYARRI